MIFIMKNANIRLKSEKKKKVVKEEFFTINGEGEFGKREGGQKYHLF